MAHILCHAAGWCAQSQAALIEWRQKIQQFSNDYYCIRWDGRGFFYSSEKDADSSIRHGVRILLNQNKGIFEQLYVDIHGNYEVPKEFVIPKESLKKSADTWIEGYVRGQFFWPILPASLTPVKVTLYYQVDCHHAAEYLPLWNKMERICDELCTGFFKFETRIYDKRRDWEKLPAVLKTKGEINLPLITLTSIL